MQDWDLVDHAKFPHLVMDNFMKHVYYEEMSVVAMETEEWVYDV